MQQSKAEETAMTKSPFPTGRTVPFPYETPYRQQVELMESILTCLKQHSSKTPPPTRAAVMMLESPTGTGKSLSLACAAVAWLRHVEQRDLFSSEQVATKNKSSAEAASTGLDWLNAWVPPEEKEDQKRKSDGRERAQQARDKLHNELSTIRTRLKIDQKDGRLRERRENLARSAVTASKMVERKRRRKQGRVITRPSSKQTNAPISDYCVEHYHSDDSKGQASDSDEDEKENRFSNSSDAETLLDGGSLDGSGLSRRSMYSCGKIPNVYSLCSVSPGSGVRKIVFAARTHSQLSQFVGELRRTKWGSTLRVVALGGRQTLCGNPDVRGRGRFAKSESVISEACLDMQKGTTTAGQKRSQDAKTQKGSCPLLSSKSATATLALHILAQPSDIEDAARLGEASHTCAYYASRESLAAAEVVVLPYSMLLSKQARAAVGLSLQQSFVIVDEAHNLPEALRSLHLCRLTLPIIKAALAALVAYTDRYASRLAGRNLFYLGQIRKCLNAFIKHLSEEPPESAKNAMISPAELLIKLRLDNVNLFKILRYLEQSRLCQKLLGFMNLTQQNDEGKDASQDTTDDPHALSKHVSPLSIVQTFLERLTSNSSEGKVVTDWPRDGVEVDLRSSHAIRYPTLRYVLLRPAAHFQNVLDDAHAVALVGGTLRPFAHIAAELVADNDIVQDAAKADAKMKSTTSASFVSSTLTAFSCDHVVPPTSVSLSCLSTGPTNVKLDFRHQSRNSHGVCDELGRSLVNICKVVPHGIVVFLPSYSYEAHLVRRWKATGLLEDLKGKKRVHREPKSSQQVEIALESYSRDALSPGGAILLSVVGGKMSEGINFADDMARCVVVAGLPYPDITDPELREKMSNMDQAAKNKGNGAAITGQSYYQNLCMRAVNQSIGRAIRHANDHAAIVLADSRYATDSRIWQGLPQWLRRGAGCEDGNHGPKSFGHIQRRLSDFFEERKQKIP